MQVLARGRPRLNVLIAVLSHTPWETLWPISHSSLTEDKCLLSDTQSVEPDLHRAPLPALKRCVGAHIRNGTTGDTAAQRFPQEGGKASEGRALKGICFSLRLDHWPMARQERLFSFSFLSLNVNAFACHLSQKIRK